MSNQHMDASLNASAPQDFWLAKQSCQALTVSPSYAVECCTDPEKGVELEKLFSLGKCTGQVPQLPQVPQVPEGLEA